MLRSKDMLQRTNVFVKERRESQKGASTSQSSMPSWMSRFQLDIQPEEESFENIEKEGASDLGYGSDVPISEVVHSQKALWEAATKQKQMHRKETWYNLNLNYHEWRLNTFISSRKVIRDVVSAMRKHEYADTVVISLNVLVWARQS